MFSIKGAWGCACWNLRLLAKNLRFYLGLFLGFLICFFLTQRTIQFSGIFGTELQMFEPFVWCFADSDSVLFASLALLLPLSQVPSLNAPASYLIFRTGRRSWMIGQTITAILLSLFYTLFLLAGTCLLAGKNAFWANRWSDTAMVMSFIPDQLEVSIKVARSTVKLSAPFNCALQIFLLTAQYMLFLSLVNLAVSLRFGKQAGMSAMIGISLAAYLLTPDRFMAWMGLDIRLGYIANLLAAWFSPLQHATYTMHSFGYDSLPALWQTHLIMGGVNIGLLGLCGAAAEHISFLFRRGER